jgi:hypothetical protein
MNGRQILRNGTRIRRVWRLELGDWSQGTPVSRLLTPDFPVMKCHFLKIKEAIPFETASVKSYKNPRNLRLLDRVFVLVSFKQLFLFVIEAHVTALYKSF